MDGKRGELYLPYLPPYSTAIGCKQFQKSNRYSTITVTQDRRWTARRAATTAALYTVMPVILGPDGPKFIPAVAQATTDKDAPGAALGVQLTQDTSLPRGRAMAVSAEVEGGDGTSLPQGKAPAVPTEVEEDGGTNLPHGKAAQKFLLTDSLFPDLYCC